MTKKLCTAAGCRTVVDHNNDGSSPRCNKHQRKTYTPTTEERQRKYEHHYDEQGRNLYHTTRWKKLRAAKVAINPICEHCETLGIARSVEEVDHIIEIEDGGTFWDISNLQSLCRRHHKIKTDKAKADRLKSVDEFGYLTRSRLDF